MAAYRELVGHDDQADPLGQAPKPGQVESYAAWRSAWRALGRPEADRAEAEMSTGQLRVRIRAYEREKTWAPDYVADQLAATRQAADKHRTDATLWNAQADATGATDKTSQLSGNSAEAAALAQTLDQRAHELAAADEVRSACPPTPHKRAPLRKKLPLSSQPAVQVTHPSPARSRPRRGWLLIMPKHALKIPGPIADDHDLSLTVEQRARDQREARAAEPSSESAGTPPSDIREETAADADAKRRANQLARAAVWRARSTQDDRSRHNNEGQWSRLSVQLEQDSWCTDPGAYLHLGRLSR